ncbi:MAG: 1-acyl-sn-glycerol-3-phosphate acyltransferase [Bacteroidota bacterium]
MIKKLFAWFFRVKGWTFIPTVPQEAYKRCVMIAAPHTTNWDAVYTIGAFEEMGVPVRFTVKKEAGFFPLGAILSSAGALWIDRSGSATDRKAKSYVDIMADFFTDHEELVMLVSAEGTRSLVKQWKTGFYRVAQQAGVPIALGYLDYERKEAGVGALIDVTGDMEYDLGRIMAFYSTIQGKFPQKFSLDERYPPVAQNT